MKKLQIYNKLKAKINSFKCTKFVQKTINFFNKNNFKKTKLIIAIFLTFILSIVFEKYIYGNIIEFMAKPIDDQIGTYDYEITNISKARVLLVWSAFYFIFMHFILKLKDIYDFLYKHRYKIAGVFLLFVMITKIHGSSIVWYTTHLLNTKESRVQELFGMSRFIRSDEYATQTMYILSQTEGENKFSYFNDRLRATQTDMFTVVNSPVKDILMIGKPFQLGFLLFGKDAGLSFYWYARIVAMLLGSFELCMILTNKNKKLSLAGMVIISFSSAVQWWYCMDCLIWGQIILVLIDKFMNTDKKYVKYLCSFGIISSCLAYAFILYPAWQITFAYVFLALLIWIVVKNIRNEYKFTKNDIVLIFITILSILALLIRWLLLSHNTITEIMSTKYPGNRIGLGGNIKTIFSYFYSILFPFIYFPNPCEYSNMLSYFPIPILIAIVYLVKNKKKDLFLYLTLGVSAFFGIYCFIGFPKFLAKITLLSMTITERAEIPFGVLNIYIFIYLLSKIDIKDVLLNKKSNIAITILMIIILITSLIFSKQFEYMNIMQVIVLGIIFYIAIYNLLNINKEKNKNIFIYLSIVIALGMGLFVNPISRGTNIIYEKTISIAVRDIVKQDPDGVWIVDKMNWLVSNYLVANGAKTLTSTNVYPNIKFYEDLLGEDSSKYEEVFNRYHHIELEIVDSETKVSLKSEDSVEIKLNYKDLSKIGVDYIITRKNLKIEIPEIEVEELNVVGTEIIYKVIK